MLNNGSRLVAASILALAGGVMLGFHGVALRDLDRLEGAGILCLVVGGAGFVWEYGTSWFADRHQAARRVGRVSADFEREEARV